MGESSEFGVRRFSAALVFYFRFAPRTNKAILQGLSGRHHSNLIFSRRTAPMVDLIDKVFRGDIFAWSKGALARAAPAPLPSSSLRAAWQTPLLAVSR